MPTSTNRLSLILAMILAMTLAVSLGVSYATEVGPSNFLADTCSTASCTLPYRFFVPPSYVSTTQYPLIMFMHGSGELGTNNTAQLTAGNQDANGAMELVFNANNAVYPCFLVAPQTTNALGWGNDAQDCVMAIIAKMEAAYNIDPNRIIVTGLSLGGYGTYNIVNRYPGSFAAAVPLSGQGGGNYQADVGVPFWTFHGQVDPTVSVVDDDNTVIGMRAAGCHVIYTRFTNGIHQIWEQAYATPGLLPWMMAQTRSHAYAGVPKLAITSPPGPVNTAATVISLAGSCAFTAGDTITAVDWSTYATTSVSGSLGAGTENAAWNAYAATFTATSGTGSWSASALPLSVGTNIINVIGTGPSWNSGEGGFTTINDVIFVTRGSADTTPPTLAISTPAASSTVTTSSIAMTGTAADASGIREVLWSGNQGGSGVAVGTTSWSIGNVTLGPGTNIITVTAIDNANNSADRTLTITTSGTTPGGSGGTASTYGSSGSCGLGAASAMMLLGLSGWLTLAGMSRRRD